MKSTKPDHPFVCSQNLRSPADTIAAIDEPYQNMTSNDKIQEVQDEIDKTKDTVQQGIALAIDRGDKLDELDDKAQNLQNEAAIFNKRAKDTRRHFCLQQWKMIALIAFIVIVLIVVIWLIVRGGKKND